MNFPVPFFSLLLLPNICSQQISSKHRNCMFERLVKRFFFFKKKKNLFFSFYCLKIVKCLFSFHSHQRVIDCYQIWIDLDFNFQCRKTLFHINNKKTRKNFNLPPRISVHILAFCFDNVIHPKWQNFHASMKYYSVEFSWILL